MMKYGTVCVSLNTPKSIPYHSHIYFSVNEVEASSINEDLTFNHTILTMLVQRI